MYNIRYFTLVAAIFSLCIFDIHAGAGFSRLKKHNNTPKNQTPPTSSIPKNRAPQLPKPELPQRQQNYSAEIESPKPTFAGDSFTFVSSPAAWPTK